MYVHVYRDTDPVSLGGTDNYYNLFELRLYTT